MFLSTEVARARRIDGEGERDKLCKDGRRDREKEAVMENNVSIEIGKVSYGRVQVTVPMHIKLVVLAWASKSGMKRAEFLRTAFLIGAQQLATSVNAKLPNEDYSRQDSSVVDLRGMGSPDR
jgi:hypothetical protein